MTSATRCPTCGQQRREYYELLILPPLYCPCCGSEEVQGLAEVSIGLPECEMEIQRLIGEFLCEDCGYRGPASHFK